MDDSLVKSVGSSVKPKVTITASAAASVTAAAKAAMNKALKDNVEINDAVSKVLDGYDWTLVPVPAKYAHFTFFAFGLNLLYLCILFIIQKKKNKGFYFV